MEGMHQFTDTDTHTQVFLSCQNIDLFVEAGLCIFVIAVSAVFWYSYSQYFDMPRNDEHIFNKVIGEH